MQVVPVLDLRFGCAVHAVAGRRDQYAPIAGSRQGSAGLCGLLRTWRDLFGMQFCYVADLDGIVDGSPQWGLLQELRSADVQIWLDSGIRTSDCLAEVRRQPDTVPVIGTETAADVAGLLSSETADSVIVSLDLRNGQLVTANAKWRTAGVLHAACELYDIGVRRLLVLDIAAVGVGRGVPTLPLCRQLKQEFPELFLITGGGVRSPDCLLQARDAGVDALLVASALHDGRITPEDVRRVTA